MSTMPTPTDERLAEIEYEMAEAIGHCLTPVAPFRSKEADAAHSRDPGGANADLAAARKLLAEKAPAETDSTE